VELFAIHCTTCKARLIVKDESVIGDILACPKCNSMVQIVPPIGWKRPAGGDSSPGELPAAPATTSPAAAPSPPKKKAAAAIPPALPAKAASPSVAAPSPQTLASAPEPAPAEVAPTLVATLAARLRRDWILLCGGLLGGVVLGAAVWFVAARQSPPPQIVAEAPPDVAQPAVQRPAPAGDESHQPASLEPPSARRPAQGPADAPNPEVQPIAAPVDEPAATAEAATAAADAAKPPAAKEPPAQTVPLDRDASETQHQPSLKLEPVRANDAGEASDIGTFLTPGPAAPSEGNSLSDEPANADPTPVDDAADTADAPDAASPSEPTRLSSDEIDDRLSVSLAAVEFADVSLAQFATFIADVSGVRVIVDDEALAKAGTHRRATVSVKLADTTAGQALGAVLDSVGLIWVARDGKIVVTAKRQ
jgi:hypothetical protein